MNSEFIKIIDVLKREYLIIKHNIIKIVKVDTKGIEANSYEYYICYTLINNDIIHEKFEDSKKRDERFAELYK